MPADETPAGVLHAVGSGGWNVSTPVDVDPAYLVVVTVVEVG
jgi:hypothetical protein